jgi:hypothetical protein
MAPSLSGSQILPSPDLPPSQTTARPSSESRHYQTASRDVGLVESGFALTTLGAYDLELDASHGK